MRFALLGDHPDGIDFACALAATGRHLLTAHCGSPEGFLRLKRQGAAPRRCRNLDDILTEDDIEALIIAVRPGERFAQVRRSLQEECHVLCVHPLDASAIAAHEIALLQADTGRIVLPLAPMALHPAFARFKELFPWRAGEVGAPRILELEIWSRDAVLLEGEKPALPGWDVLRFIGGEIATIAMQAAADELTANTPVLASGRFVSGILLQASWLPDQAEARVRLAAVATTGVIELVFEHGWPGAARLCYRDASGADRVERWSAIDPWTAFVNRFEQALEHQPRKIGETAAAMPDSLTRSTPQLGWEDAIRALELDEAARRSVAYGRSSTLDHQEASEEASFKGTMTLAGCSLVWLALALLIASAWIPGMLWVIVPLFGLFLFLQVLRWILPSKG